MNFDEILLKQNIVEIDPFSQVSLLPHRLLRKLVLSFSDCLVKHLLQVKNDMVQFLFWPICECNDFNVGSNGSHELESVRSDLVYLCGAYTCIGVADAGRVILLDHYIIGLEIIIHF